LLKGHKRRVSSIDNEPEAVFEQKTMYFSRTTSMNDLREMNQLLSKRRTETRAENRDLSSFIRFNPNAAFKYALGYELPKERPANPLNAA